MGRTILQHGFVDCEVGDDLLQPVVPIFPLTHPLHLRGRHAAVTFTPVAEQCVASGELDIAFSCALNQHQSVAALPLFEDDLVAAVSRSHRLARGNCVEARQLRDLVHITYSQVVEAGLDDDLFFRPARFAPAKVREVSTFAAIFDFVAKSVGFTLLNRWEADHHVLRDSIVLLSLTATGLKVTWSALERNSEAGPTLSCRLAVEMA